ncbi:MAG: hypothetical protein A3H64_00835 [Candidatus Ryanbacteria bacterium RIFCSPLOWO2_02_FULL_45_11c]|uniref:Solute-binding protein family 5 domain-containing protein n=1 Tax=Candidatus Ryanbacteria bacterium RIFCSPLOWO2_02_FULL_45_11c TaxID=1802128 RepID=A0A1G2H2B9_9BACT|nr:MAG: hypothetical protein A3H64_00835 [Candidatus Ryanbacteria bacterium RIFCSPLOWO2_02_FULL_45_11c]
METTDSEQKYSLWASYRSFSPAQRQTLPRLLTKKDRVLLLIFFTAFIVSFTYGAYSLTDRYSIAVPAEGGALREGIIGIPRFINPLLASSDADRDLTAVVYSGLLRNNGKGELVTSLADHFEISDDGLTYTFYLKDDLRWSDGERVGADDVLFTISLVKDPNYRSVLRPNWEGVIVEKKDEKTIEFKLAKPYAPFLENVTIGILPKHVWQDVLAPEFTLSEKNLRPVGAGPYRVVSFEQNSTGRIASYTLEPNPHYMPHAPPIKTLTFVFFTSATELQNAYQNNLIDSASIPGMIPLAFSDATTLSLPLPRIFGVFFNQNSSKALADDAVREALTYATNREHLVESVLQNQGIAIWEPLPPQTLTSENTSNQNPYLFDVSASTEILTKAGWIDSDEDGIREKEIDKANVPLSFTISTSDAPDLVSTARLLQEMWRQVGAQVNLSIFEIGDFEQDVLRPRKYEAVLFGEVFGFEPDPFAFWHSSQRNDPGLNIALYTNPRADTLLEQARTQIDRAQREKTYREFQHMVTEEHPAVFLYSPYYHYKISATVHGHSITRITNLSDRFGSIHEWFIKTKKQWKN